MLSGALLSFALANLKHDAEAVFAWLSHRSFWQLMFGAALILAGWEYIGKRAEQRHAHKVETQLSKCTDARKSDQKAFAQTTANYRAAALEAQRADAANKVRVESEQAQISKEQSDDYEARIAAARAQYQRLQRDAAAANSGGAAGTPMPGVSTAAGGPSEATCQAGLPDALTATEQAIQLDELIQWIKRQHLIDPNGKPHG